MSSEPPTPVRTLLPRPIVSTARPAQPDDAVICERCGQHEMYRMHAVWRCPGCGYKTDCCGW